IGQSLSSKADWDYTPSERRRVTEARYYRNRPTADQVADMYLDVKKSGMEDRWDRIILGAPRLYDNPYDGVRVVATVTLRDEQKAIQYVKRFLKSNNLPYTGISSDYFAFAAEWEISIIYKEDSSQITEARYAGPTRPFVVSWPNDTWAPGRMKSVSEEHTPGTYYDYGTTKAPQGIYTREDQVAAVAETKEKALKESRIALQDWEITDYGKPLEWKHKRVTPRFLDEIGESIALHEHYQWEYHPLGKELEY
ncbi:hypothetical protein LCGC14_2841050, partial [marine sediment metagenome]